MKDAHLVIDCQVLQSPARDRGMGKYSLELVRALSESKQNMFQKIVFIFNQNLPQNEPAETFIRNHCPNSEIHYLKLRVSNHLSETRTNQAKNQKILDDFIEKMEFKETHFFILALFLYEICPAFPTKSIKHLLFYDLIPLLYFERYAASEPTYDQNYLERFNTILEADNIFTISKTVANDLVIYLGIPESKVCSIDGASIQREHLKPLKPSIINNYGIGKYILMPSGEDLRKNNESGVAGFALFNEKHDNKYKMLVTSHFSDATKDKLKQISKDVIFTDNVTEAELSWLYQNCETVFFPTEYEGLGLPVLEALDYNKPIACSAIPVFEEISKDAFHYFDPHSMNEMAIALEDSLTKSVKTNEYKQISKDYTWNGSANKFYQGLRQLVPGVKTVSSKSKIAIVCPDPTGFSAIGKVVMESHYTASRYFEIDYYFETGRNHRIVRENFLKRLANCYTVDELTRDKYKEYEKVIYHIGNSEYHVKSAIKALYLKGVIVLHDTDLTGLWGVIDEVGAVDKRRIEIEKRLNDKVQKAKMSYSILIGHSNVIVHSDYAAKALQVLGLDNVTKLNLPVSPSLFFAQDTPRRQKHVGIAGILARVKGTEVLTLLRKDNRFDRVKLFAFGHAFLAKEDREILEELKGVSLITDLKDRDFQQYLSKLNVLINYRESYKGETSLTLLEAMRHGVLGVVRDVGWYSELPNERVVKVKDSKSLTEELHALLGDNARLRAASLSSYEYVKKNHSHELYISQLYALIQSTNN